MMNVNRLFASALMLFLAVTGVAGQKVTWSGDEKPIADQIRGLRSLPDDQRASVTGQLAMAIRRLPVVPNKLRLASALANVSTEGDFGRDVLQEVATTLAMAVREQPPAETNGGPADQYMELAQLSRYEHVQVKVDSPQFTEAMAALEKIDQKRQSADFTLTDLQGTKWNLKGLRGKVVLVNFWATWCPPCRKEMPDLEKLYQRYKDRGFVILAISDEDEAKVKPFVAEHGFTFPILLDPGRKVNEELAVLGIPKSFVYDRSGKLVAQAIDMRTDKQFQTMLAQANLQ